MVLRTPRRRVSPQTKLKYRAFKKFFNRTLGNQSQSDINTYSNETITNDTTSFQFNDRNDLNDTRTETYLNKVDGDGDGDGDDLTEVTSSEGLVDREEKFVDHQSITNTELLYKKSKIKSESTCNYDEEYPVLNKKNHNNELNYDNMDICSSYTRERRNVSKNHKTIERLKKAEDWPDYLSDSNASVDFKKVERNLNEQRRKKKTSKKEYLPINLNEEIDRHRKKIRCSSPIDEDNSKVQYNDKDINNVDQDFINEIIRRQYKPVTLFDRKYSEVSQITAPVCRDQEYAQNDIILEGDMCSCVPKSRKPKYTCYNDLSDMRSVCDTRLYSNDKKEQPKRRKKYTANYNDSLYYDMVPVKEKQSPKSRRKYAENALMNYDEYREVPPSPRTLRAPSPKSRRKYAEDALMNYDEYREVPPSPRTLRAPSPKSRRKYAEDALMNYDEYKEVPPSPRTLRAPSPKSRRKYAEDALINYDEYREVPPSPRTLRPRLNLDAQYHNIYEDLLETENLSDNPPNRRKCQEVYREMQLSGCSVGESPLKNSKEKRYSSSHGNLNLGHINDEDTIQAGNQSTANVNTSQNSINEDKTDKTLGEIKSILQNFLEEIKKESSVADTDRPECVQNSTIEPQQDASTFFPQLPTNSNLNTNNVNSNLQNNLPSPMFMPPFLNPCCYPVLPFSTANCMQNGFVMPTQSTCHDCSHVKETDSDDVMQTQTKKRKPSETDVLIKEIYKFVAQKSFLDKSLQKETFNRVDKDISEPKVYTTRSVGSCRNLTRLNAKTGTPQIRCYSKSCEALVSYTATNIDNTETTNYSDTLYTKSSQDATPLTSDFSSSIPHKSTIKTDRPETKFRNILQSFGLLKKKKSDLMKEKGENNVMTDMNDHHNKHSPFKQNVTSCMMHEQEYFHPPPRPAPHFAHQRRPAYDPDYVPGYSYRSPRFRSPPPGDGHYMPTNRYHYNDRPPHDRPPHDRPAHDRPAHDRPSHDWPPSGHDHHYSNVPYSSSYDPFYDQIPPPICLKEIEVKSTATQSERKFKFFKRFASSSPIRKLPEKPSARIRDYSTQTQTSSSKKLEPTKTGPSFWRTWQEKALADHYRLDAEKFQQDTQKQLDFNENKIKNAMIKNLFHKRNPFSPNNLIIKTLLGKDQSSFGDPPKFNTKPSMFV